MVTNVSKLRKINLLVDATINEDLNWINLDVLKRFLQNTNRSLNVIQPLHEYLIHLQKDLFIFDCVNTHLTVFEDKLFILAKSKHSLTYRLDSLNLTLRTIKWESMNVPMNMLLRIRNAIDLISNHTDENMCKNFLSTISLESLV